MSAEIRHIVEPHPVSGLTNGKLGVWLFLASEVMLFGALFSTYIILRTSDPNWHAHGLNIPLATVNTMVLITSSITMVMAWASLAMDQFGKFRLYMGGTIALALTFLVIKYVEYGAKFEHHIYPSTSTFYAIYFTMTGLHVLHVIGGIVVNGYLLGPGSKMWQKDKAHFTGRVENAGLYWHFVDLVWIFLFPTLYLLP